MWTFNNFNHIAKWRSSYENILTLVRDARSASSSSSSSAIRACSRNSIVTLTKQQTWTTFTAHLVVYQIVLYSSVSYIRLRILQHYVFLVVVVVVVVVWCTGSHQTPNFGFLFQHLVILWNENIRRLLTWSSLIFFCSCATRLCSLSSFVFKLLISASFLHTQTIRRLSQTRQIRTAKNLCLI